MRWLILLLLAATAAWSQPGPTAPQTVEALKQAATGLANFALNGDIATYTRDNLWEYIDGDAERYFVYDYDWTVAGSLKDRRSNVAIGVDIYRFKSDLDAFGAATLDRDPATPGDVIPLGGQASLISAYWAGNQLHVWRGNLYVRLVPGSLKDTLTPAVLEVGQAVLAKLPGTDKDPLMFRVTPTRDLITESVKFQRHNVLGQAFLNNALLATYGRRLPERRLDADMDLLLFDGLDPAGAAQTYQALAKYLGEGATVRPVGALGEAALTVRHATYGTTYAMRQGRFVAMLREVKSADAAEALLRELGKNIRLAR